MNRLRKLRLERKMSLRDLADEVNISYPTLSRLENDTVGFNDESLIILSEFFNVSIDYLLCRTNEIHGSSYSESDAPVEENEIDPFQFALYGEVKDLTDEQKRDILDMIKIIKRRDPK